MPSIGSALDSTLLRITELAAPGFLLQASAATAATIGADIEVPLPTSYPMDRLFCVPRTNVWLGNVEYTLTVTDTQTGAVKTYTNPQNRLASFADTQAF